MKTDTSIMGSIIHSLKSNTILFSILKKTHIIFGVTVVILWITSYGFTWAVENLERHFSIALTMVFGSMVAGGTALGGGSVAFPVLTKILNIIPFEAKVFSLAIQSFGMTAASATIICRRIAFYPRMVLLALTGALPGVIISLTWISDLIPRLATKSIFSLLLLAFAIVSIKTHVEASKGGKSDESMNYMIPIIGFIGGIVSGLLGSGADIFVFSLLVLFYRLDIKMATATSVIVMAVVSVFATFYNAVVLETITPKIQQYVHAAAPIVIVGAPLGAWICSRLSNIQILFVLLFLISLEISFTTYELVTNFIYQLS